MVFARYTCNWKNQKTWHRKNEMPLIQFNRLISFRSLDHKRVKSLPGPNWLITLDLQEKMSAHHCHSCWAYPIPPQTAFRLQCLRSIGKIERVFLAWSRFCLAAVHLDLDDKVAEWSDGTPMTSSQVHACGKDHAVENHSLLDCDHYPALSRPLPLMNSEALKQH